MSGCMILRVWAGIVLLLERERNQRRGPCADGSAPSGGALGVHVAGEIAGESFGGRGQAGIFRPVGGIGGGGVGGPRRAGAPRADGGGPDVEAAEHPGGAERGGG